VISGFRKGDYLVKRDLYDRSSEQDQEIGAVDSESHQERTYGASFDELRTGFTAVVSHELRTPLARILALLDSTDLPGADVHDLIEQARAEVENAGALIDEILFLSELESGKEIVSLGRTNALPVLEEVAGSLDGAAGRAGVSLRVEGDPYVDVPLRPRMLRIVAENLAENGIRYAGEGANFTFTVSFEGSFAVISAADNGVGVSEADLPRLFERFYRGDTARTSRGTGLGLAIVKHIVAAAGGEIDAASDGRGLRISAAFPV
jgi:signal transduction histidine kinase